MNQYTARNMKIDGTKITIDVDGQGSITADLAEWHELIKAIGGIRNIKLGELQGDLIKFPNDTHIEIEDLLELAER
jgi:hypothetical protein